MLYILSILGLVLDIMGAWLIARSLMVFEPRQIKIRNDWGYDLNLISISENCRQTADAQVGGSLMVSGFLLQLAGQISPLCRVEILNSKIMIWIIFIALILISVFLSFVFIVISNLCSYKYSEQVILAYVWGQLSNDAKNKVEGDVLDSLGLFMKLERLVLEDDKEYSRRLHEQCKKDLDSKWQEPLQGNPLYELSNHKHLFNREKSNWIKRFFKELKNLQLWHK